MAYFVARGPSGLPTLSAPVRGFATERDRAMAYFKAAASGDVETVLDCLASGVDVNKGDELVCVCVTVRNCSYIVGVARGLTAELEHAIFNKLLDF